MKKAENGKVELIRYNHHKRRVWTRLVSALAVVVVFVTTYMLILPAITMENEASCGITEHQHDAGCYSSIYEPGEKRLSCTAETLGLHTHNQSCFDAEGKLICGYADYVIHSHDAGCYDAAGTLVCPLAEHSLHVHTAACLQSIQQLICTLPESEEHTHSESCCETVQVLICEEPSELHTHTDACYQDGVLVCGKTELKEHQHGEDCYTQEQVLVETLICDQQEHVHTDECYAKTVEEETTEEETTEEETTEEETTEEETTEAETTTEEETTEEETTEEEITEEEATTEEETTEEEATTEEETTEEETTEKETTEEETTSEEETTEEGIATEEAVTEEETTEEETTEEVTTEENRQIDIDNWDVYTDGPLFIADKIGDAAAADDSNPIPAEEKQKAIGVMSYRSVAQLMLASSTQPEGTDFSPYITSAVVQKIVNGMWQNATEFDNGDSVQVKLAYTLLEGVVIPSRKSIWYQLPDGVIPNEDLSGTVINKSGNAIGTYTIGINGIIQITFNDDFATGKEITGDIFFSGHVESDNTNEDKVIEFGGSSSSITIKKEEEEEVKTDISIKKQASLSEAKDEIQYTVTISSSLGTGEAVKLEDYLTNGTFIKDSVEIKKSGSQVEKTQYSLSFDNTSDQRQMKIESLPALNAGEEYVITYKVKPGVPSSNGELKVDNIACTNKGRNASWSQTVRSTLVSKNGSYNSDKNTVEWTVTINPDGRDLNGYVISDKLNGQLLTDYKAVLKKPDGSTKEIILPYTFDESTTGVVSYTISYETGVDSDAASGNVKNDVIIEKGDDKYEAGSDVGYTRRDWDLQKYFETSEKTSGQDEITYTWKSAITLPDENLSKLGEFTYEDTIGEAEKHYAIKADVEEAIKSQIEFEYIDEAGNSHTVSGESVNEYFTYHITYTPDNSDRVSAFTIVFSPKSELAVKGKKITLSYSTKADTSDIQSGTSVTFTNTAKVKDTEKIASVDYRKPIKLQKGSSAEGALLPPANIWWETGSEYRGYVQSLAEMRLDENGYLYYRLVLNLEDELPVEGQQVIQAELQDLLPVGTTYVEGSAFATYCVVDSGGNVNAVIYSGNPITVNTSVENKRNDQDEEYQKLNISLDNIQPGNLKDSKVNGYIAVYYAVKVDAEILEGNGILSLTNKAEWGKEYAENTTNIKKVQKIVEKTGEQVTDQNQNPLDAIQYRVVINPGAADLDLEKDTLTLVDTISYNKLSSVTLNLNTVKLYYYDPFQEDMCGDEISSTRYQVRYDRDNGKMTVIVPDALACVLVYQYSYDRGSLADTDGILVDASVSNSVKLMGESSKSDVTQLKVNNSGATARQNIEIYKVDSVDYTKKLSGAQFTLEIWKDNSWQQVGIYVSGDGSNGTKLGEIELKTATGDELTEGEIWKNYYYRLSETQAPSGYQRMMEPYYFVMTDGDVSSGKDYYSLDEQIKASVHKISPSGENIYIPNTANGLKVRKVWVDQNNKEISNPTGNIQVQLYKSTGTIDGANVTVKWRGNNDPQKDILVKRESTITIYSKFSYGGFDCSDSSVSKSQKQDEKGNWIYIFSGITKDCVIGYTDNNTWYGSDMPDIEYTEATDIVFGNDNSALGDPVTLEESNGWSYEWSNLEVGDQIYYHVKEVGTHSGYTVSYMNNGGIHSGEIVITNKVEEQIVLPETGGSGTDLYTLSGLFLMAGATLLMYINSVKKGGRRIR